MPTQLCDSVTDEGALTLVESDIPVESKSKWEENETAFRHRLRDPLAFKPRTFRTIVIQRTKPRVLGVVAKPKEGNDSMTLQTLIFPKDQGWTMASARAWAGKHPSLKEQNYNSDFTGGSKETKEFAFDLKEVSEEGTFSGMLSIYNEIDLGGDSVQPGAFDKSLAESNYEIPCQWQHRDPIGMLKVTPVEKGLWVDGQLALATLPNGTPMVPEAYKALALMRAKVVKGLSIGYKALKAPFEEGVRKLKEVRLLEGSIVTFPMLPIAQVVSVKADGQKEAFEDELYRLQIMASRYQMMEALGRSLDTILYASDLAATDKLSQSQAAVERFSTLYISMLPDFMSECGMDEGEGDGEDAGGESVPKSAPPIESKAGRTISAATAERLRSAIDILQSLLGDSTTLEDNPPDEEDSRSTAGDSTPVATKSTLDEPEPPAPQVEEPVAAPPPPPPPPAPEPPPLDSIAKEIRGIFSWN